MASLALAVGCRGNVSQANLGALTLTLVNSTAVAPRPSPCAIDIDFGGDDIGRPAGATLRIANGTSAPVTFSAPASTLGSAFAADFQGLAVPLQPAGSTDVGLTFDPVASGPTSTSFSIRTSLSGGACPSLGLSLTGTGIDAALVVNPATLDLGNALVNTAVEKTVTLTNQATDPVAGLSASIGGANPGDFALIGVPEWLDAGASGNVQVMFQPKAQVSRSTATVTFAGSAGQSATLSLSGEPLASALTLTPDPLNFGYVVPASSVIACTTAANISNVPVTISGLGSFTSAEGAFALSAVDDAMPAKPAPVPVTIQPGGSAEVCFSLTPSVPAAYTGQVALLTDASGMDPVLQLVGSGGGPQLSCTPTSLAFGQAVDGIDPTLTVVCTNIGTSYTGNGNPPVTLVLSPSTSPMSFGATFDAVIDPYPITGLQPAQSAQIDVTYHPSGTSTDTGTLLISNNAGRGEGLPIPLSGQSLNLAPCQFVVSPPALDFGNVGGNVGGNLQLDAGSASDSSVFVENIGNDACLVKDLAVTDPTDSFRIVSTSLQPDPVSGWITIPAASGVASALQIDLAFLPADAGAFTGQADFWISNPTETQQAVPLRGTSGSPCLVYVPSSLDFGTVGTKDGGSPCLSASRTLSVFNQCTGTAVALQSIGLQPEAGDAPQQFSVPAPSATPLGSSDPPQSYSVSFNPTTLGTHNALLVLSDGTADILLPITGRAVAAPTQTDSFVAGPPKVDLLFVRDVDDDACSEPEVAAQLADFLDAGADTDYRLAVTTDDNGEKPEPNYGGWLQPCALCYAQGTGPTIVSPSTIPDGGSAPDPVSAFVDLLGAGGTGFLDTGSYKDKHLVMALYQALERDPRPGLDFFRPGAYLAVINESCDNIADGSEILHPVEWFESFFAAWLPDSALFSWNYISNEYQVTGTGLDDPASLPPDIETMVTADGLALNLADSNWPQPFLSIWTAVARANLRYHLSTVPPMGASGLAVSLNGGSATGWTYDAATNAVVFAPGSAPQSGDHLQVTYPIGCR